MAVAHGFGCTFQFWLRQRTAVKAFYLRQGCQSYSNGFGFGAK
jgi:hypothetical protein